MEIRFPLIFAIVVDQEATVASYLGGRGAVVWDIQLRWQVQDWEVAQLVELWGSLYGLGLIGVRSNVMVWNGVGARGQFIVSLFYWGLVWECGRVLHWKSIWMLGVPSKVVFFNVDNCFEVESHIG